MKIRPSQGRCGLVSLVLVSTLGISAHADLLFNHTFNSSAGRPTVASYQSGSGFTPTASYTSDGTIDTYSGYENQVPAPTTSASLVANCAGASPGWTAGIRFARFPVTSYTHWTGKYTLSFDGLCSLSRPFRVTVRSFANATDTTPTGTATLPAAQPIITPPVASAYYRYTLELGSLSTSPGFDPAGPYIEVSFEVKQADGWPNSAGNTLRIDNLAYATPKYFVDGKNGSNSNSGLSETAAFKTLQRAADAALQPGDVIAVMYPAGATPYTTTGGAVMNLGGKSGTPSAWIVVRAYPGQRPVIKLNASSNTWTGISMGNGSAYLEIRDMDLVGTLNDPGVTYNGALADYDSTTPTGAYNCTGIFANGRTLDSEGKPVADETLTQIRYRADRPHHIKIVNCSARDFHTAGIGAIMTDYLTIADCDIVDNCTYGRYGGSGITTLDNWRFDNSRETKVFILNNYVFGNKSIIKAKAYGRLSDGNGIIIDDSRNCQSGSLGVPRTSGDNSNSYQYLGRILVQNNLCVNNGGGGIHVWRSQSVDVVNNTCYKNSSVLDYGEITTARSPWCRLYNNLLWGNTGQQIVQDTNEGKTGRSGSLYGYNIYWNDQGAAGTHWNKDVANGYSPTPLNPSTLINGDVIANPLFIAASTDPATANFEVQATSPAVSTGLDGVYVRRPDIDGVLRAVGTNNLDRGAFER